jgi:hypothetical protein
MQFIKISGIQNFDFKFQTKLFETYDLELPFEEHFEELRQRIYILSCFFISAFYLNFNIFIFYSF